MTIKELDEEIARTEKIIQQSTSIYCKMDYSKHLRRMLNRKKKAMKIQQTRGHEQWKEGLDKKAKL